METVSVYLQKIEDLLSRMEDIIESSRPLPLSSKVSLDKHMIYDIIDEIRPLIDDLSRDLPNELQSAKRLIMDSDKILNDARNKSSQILQNAENDASKLTNEHAIYKAAKEQAEQHIEEAKKSARDLRVRAMEYADEILSNSESMLREALDSFSRKMREVEGSFSDTIDTLYDNRQDLRGMNK